MYFLGLVFNYSLQAYYSVLVSAVQHSGSTITYFTKCFSWYFQSPPGPVYAYYDIIDSISYALLYIPVTIL